MKLLFSRLVRVCFLSGDINHPLSLLHMKYHNNNNKTQEREMYLKEIPTTHFPPLSIHYISQVLEYIMMMIKKERLNHF